MNQLTDLLTAIRNFMDRHRMVTSYNEISVIDELEELGSEFRRVTTFPLSFELDDDMIAITYGIVIQDKVRGGDMLQFAKSNEQNIFILSQLQDYLTTIDKDIEISGGEFFGQFQPQEPENMPTIAASITAQFMKPVYKDFDLEG